ncbi:MAG: anhydro-N-acetylmuramic acid kinase [Thermoproteota archaeon]
MNFIESLEKIKAKPKKRIIGLMSGTSADGVTASLVEVEGNYINTKVGLINYCTYSYDEPIRTLIFELFDLKKSNVEKICEANFLLGEIFAKAAIKIVKDSKLNLSEIDLIGSHGQTIYHMPKGKLVKKSTLQVGELAVIAERTGITTIGDFRKRDMAVGGEGAPLVPYVDFILFRSDKKSIVIQNIGGISNLTYLPSGCNEEDVVAFDTGPGNMVIDYLVKKYTAGKFNYDVNGQIASRGEVNKKLLNYFMNNEYFSLPPPKSTGREVFGSIFAESFAIEGEKLGLKKEDIIATATALTAESIVRSYENFILSKGTIDEVYVAGGGLKNNTLINMIRKRLPQVPILPFDILGFPSEARESIYFAVLANEFIHGNKANLPNVTGASKRVLLGTLVPGNS